MDNTLLLHRPAVEAELQYIFKKPLFLISAPSGYGKTSSVTLFLNGKKCRTIWISCDINDSPHMMWHKLIKQVDDYDKELAQQLLELGFPDDPYQRGRFLDLLVTLDTEIPIVIVIDDYQNLPENGVSSLLMAIAAERIQDIHIVIVTRSMPDNGFWDFINQDLCKLLTGNQLKFTKEEILEYSRLIKLELSEETAQEIFDYSQGWILLIYLLLRNYEQGIDITHTEPIDELFEKTIYANLSEKEKQIWLNLSFLEDFSIPMALYVLNDRTPGDLRGILFKDNVLLRYNNFTKAYSFHNLYRSFLQEQAVIRSLDSKEIFVRAGQWCLQNDNFIMACYYFDKADDIEPILAELNKEDIPEVNFTQYHQIHQVFDHVTEDGLWKKYPLAYLQYLRTYLLSGNVRVRQKSARLLKEMEDYFLNTEMDEDSRNFILGEIYIIWPFVVFNDFEKMVMYNKIAEKYLNGNCSCIVTRNKEATFGSPHFLYIYYREQGKLKETTKLITENFFRFPLVSDGCGTGCDSLAQAEYNLETGDFENVELHAYKAIYKAASANQLGAVICAEFAMMRYLNYSGNFSESIKMFNALRHDVEKDNNPVLCTAFDMCNAYISCCMQDVSGLPKWLREGNFESGSFMYEGVAFNYVVYEKCLLLLREYTKLSAVCELFPNYNFQYKNQLGVLHNCIHDAIAKYYLNDVQAAEAKLAEALEMGKADHIVLPFAENAPYILNMLSSIKKKGTFEDDEYLSKIIEHSKRFKQSLREHELSREILTPREKEIITLLAQGVKYSDIAEKLFVSITTVRFHIRNIYDKFEVNNKVLMLRKARELGLIE